MNIVVIPGTNYNNAPAGFDAAVKYVTNLYDSLFSANVTVYINVDYGIISDNPTELGESYWNLYDFDYSAVRQALINMGAPGSNTIPTTSPFPNDARLWLTTAQEKALGLLPADYVPGPGYGYPGVDGNVVIASNQTWSFSPTATPAANQFYIVGALEHEFSEVLGRISYDVDVTNTVNSDPAYSIMDLFRYSSPGVHQLSATSSPAYFSTDNGNSVYYYWNTHANGFDLNGDLGDWWSSGPNNLDPTGPDAFLDISNPGQITGLSSVDLTLMQSIGWLETPVTPLNHAPVVTAPDFTASHNQNIAASALFSVSDADNDTITKYEFMDSTADPASGHWVVNGVVQGAGQAIDVTAAQLSQTSFQSGSGSDDLWVRANDGTDWSAWKEFHVNAPLNHAPVVTAPNFTASHNQNIAASALFSVSDADNDTITKYQFWDSTADSASGHWVVNGTVQGAGQAIDVTAAQLAQTTFQSGSGSDDLWVRANDGTDWSAWKEFHVNAPLNHAPVVTAPNFTASHDQNIAASSLFSVSDADGDAITKYQFWDSTADSASGHWVVNGTVQGAGQAIDVTAAQLAQTTFQSGSGSDDLWVRANDGTDWSAWKEFHVNAPLNHAPVVTAPNFTASHDQNIAASSLFSVSDADGDAITKYQFWDSTADSASGHWVVNGTVQGAGQTIDVTAAQLAQTTFQSGSGSDDLWVRANDGTDWSAWKEFHVNAPLNHAPVVTAPNFTASHDQNIAASSLFSVSDADHDVMTKYQFWDSTSDPASGHWVVNGMAQGTGQAIDVTAAQLAQTTFQSGSGSDDLWVRANDGTDWSAWKEFHVNASVDQKPVVSGSDASLTLNSSVAVTSLFSVSDPENDPIAKYEFWDSSPAATSGHFAINGTSQAAGQAIDVLAAQLNQASFVAGSIASVDQVWARAFDGSLWSDWHLLNVTSHA